VLFLSLKINKIENRAVIKFFVKGLSPKEIHLKFINVYGVSSSFSTIKKWAAEFRRGRTSLGVDPREGRPKSAPPEIIE
jgi:transposase